MKQDLAVVLATWMLEHLTFGRDHESLSGDLLEELGAGRSAGWYLRQVSMAIGVGVEFEAQGVPVKEGWWGYRLLVVEDLDGNQLFFNYPNETASGPTP